MANNFEKKWGPQTINRNRLIAGWKKLEADEKGVGSEAVAPLENST